MAQVIAVRTTPTPARGTSPSAITSRAPVDVPRRRQVVVGIGDGACTRDRNALIVTHALGSCIGVAIHDAEVGVGGILHALLPLASQHPEKASERPYACVDSGFRRLLMEFEMLGGRKNRMTVKVAGGGAMIQSGAIDHFEIGKRNQNALRKTLWMLGILVTATHAPGTRPVNMYLDMATGETRLGIDGVTTRM